MTTPRRRKKEGKITSITFFERKAGGSESTWKFKWSKRGSALKMELVKWDESEVTRAWLDRALKSFGWASLTPEKLQQKLEARWPEAYHQDEIRQVQKYLKEKGFYQGAIDGILGPLTLKALQEYQRTEGLHVTGRLDDSTRKSLRLEPS